MRKLNDVQQYSRRWKLQVFRVMEKEVTAADCTVTVCVIFSDMVGMTTQVSSRSPTGHDNTAAPEQGPFL